MEFLLLLAAAILIIKGGPLAIRSLRRFMFSRYRGDHVARHFGKIPGIRLELVKEVSNRRNNPPTDFSAWEVLATFAYMLSREDVASVFQVAKLFGDQGWKGKYNIELLDKLEQTALAFSAKNHKKHTRKLFQFGQRIAEKYQIDDWAERFAKRYEHEISVMHVKEFDRNRRWTP